MEVVMQWLDELDDLVAMLAAKAENLRPLLRILGVALAAGTTLALGAATTLFQPVVAAATASLLGIAFLYKRAQDRVPA
ncbi:MAG: hypothetical protein WBN23_13820 [Woeseia sp.]